MYLFSWLNYIFSMSFMFNGIFTWGKAYWSMACFVVCVTGSLGSDSIAFFPFRAIFRAHFRTIFRSIIWKLLMRFHQGRGVHTYSCSKVAFRSIFQSIFRAQNNAIESPPRWCYFWVNFRYSSIFEVPWFLKMCHLTVRNLTEICQKSVSYIYLSNNCQICVKTWSEIYHFQ